MITWDTGTAVSGNADLAGDADIVRLELTTIPEWYGHNADDPTRYHYLGRVGWIDGDYRDAGHGIHYADQEIVSQLPEHDGVYYSLLNGVEGTLYRGVIDMPSDIITCIVQRSTDQAITSGSWNPISFDTDRYDPTDMHESVTHPTRVTIATPGTYIANGLVGWTINVAARLSIALKVNNDYYMGSVVNNAVAGNSSLDQQCAGIAHLDAGDYIELLAYQATGSDKTAYSYQRYWPSLQVTRVGG